MKNQSNPVDQFVELKEQLTKELADLEVKIGFIKQDYEITLPAYEKRRDELVAVLFDDPVKITMEEPQDEFPTNIQRVVEFIRVNPGSSKQDLRNGLSELGENELKAALNTASKKKIVENRGISKARPAWYLM